MSYDVFLCPVMEKRMLAPGIFDFLVHSHPLAQMTQPGQFANIRVEGKTLRRPISICDVYKERGLIRLVIEIRGEGTEAICKLNIGQNMDILAPLGNGFAIPDQKGKALFVGGGIGAPPLLYAARQYGALASVFLGFRSAANAILISDFAEAGGTVRMATDDGSMGHHGFVTDLVRQALEAEAYSMIYACGPMPMLATLAKLADEKNVPCQVSLEERMACGVGACLVCACKTERDGGVDHSHVCKDGPVFDSKKVVW